MFNNLTILFLMMTFMGSVISISATTWFSAWLGLEINLISFVPLIMNNKNSLLTESAMKYFIIQASASAMFIFLCVINSLMNFYQLFMINSPNIILLLIPLMIKLGAAPFQTWFITVMQGMTWLNCYLLATLQKIAPLFLMNFLFLNNKMILLFSIFSVLVGSIGGLNQTSLKKILAFSSVNHLGWMMTIGCLSKYLFLIYFLFYSFMNLFVMNFLSKTSIFQLAQNYKFTNNYNWLISILSLGGLPPFVGFIPKWMVIQTLILNKMFMISFIMIMTALTTLFYYIRMITATMIMNFYTQKWNLISFFNISLLDSMLLVSTSGGLIIYNLIMI
uniref:NADH-ubiquinone oxidoreductase chain 2 n=1 Tax=Stenopsocus capacimacularus TaxID=3074939 RepID=A0AAU7VB28_9NEOP